MSFNTKNFAYSTVIGTYSAAATALIVSTPTQLPTAPFYAVWWNNTDYSLAG